MSDHRVLVPGGEIYYRSEVANDVRDVIDDLGAGPASVFATSVGALIGLELAAADAGAVARVVVHEPPLGQLVPTDDQASFDVELDQDDAGTALDQIAESIGLDRGRSLTGADDRLEVREDDVDLFLRRDAPAIAGYRLDLERIVSLAERIVVTSSEEGRDFCPHRCAAALAAALGPTLIELPVTTPR